MNEAKNIGKTFGIYTILGLHPEKDKDGHWLYVCECNICHTNLVRRLVDIKRRNKECKHTNFHWQKVRIGRAFFNMMNRCYNPQCKDYRWYGEKGVRICDEWLNNPKTFEEWSLNNGYTDSLTIDRIDENLNYCPENCRWIPMEDNSRRAGKVTWITIGDKTLTGRQWAEKFNLGVNTINTSIRNHGLDKTKELIEAMLKEPPSTKHRKSHQTWFDVYGIQI